MTIRISHGLASQDVGAPEIERRERLVAIVSATPWLMDALAVARAQALPEWCIGAGSIRDAVWAHLLEHDATAAAGSDVDVTYFDPASTNRDRDLAIRRELATARPSLQWDVVNQAGVHLWYQSMFGEPVVPFRSLEDAVGAWPETATCVGVRMLSDGTLQVVAPLGLSDLFDLIVRRNPRVSQSMFDRRLAEKRFDTRRPEVTVMP